MADDSRYAKMGFTIVAAFAATLLTLVYLGGWSRESDFVYAETCYDAPVTGLSVGSEVNFRGVKVGEVKGISFVGIDYPGAAEADKQKIRIVLGFDPKLIVVPSNETGLAHLKRLVAKGVHATVLSNGITGLAKVELNFPRIDVPPAKLSWASEYLYIPSAPSLMESLSASATRFMNHVNKMDMQGMCSNVAEVVESATRTVKSVDELVERSSPRITAILESLESASRSVDALAGELRSEPSLLIRSLPRDPLPETRR